MCRSPGYRIVKNVAIHRVVLTFLLFHRRKKLFHVRFCWQLPQKAVKPARVDYSGIHGLRWMRSIQKVAASSRFAVFRPWQMKRRPEHGDVVNVGSVRQWSENEEEIVPRLAMKIPARVFAHKRKCLIIAAGTDRKPQAGCRVAATGELALLILSPPPVRSRITHTLDEGR